MTSLAQSFKLKKIAPALSVKGKPAGQAVADLKGLGAKLAAAGGN